MRYESKKNARFDKNSTDKIRSKRDKDIKVSPLMTIRVKIVKKI